MLRLDGTGPEGPDDRGGIAFLNLTWMTCTHFDLTYSKKRMNLKTIALCAHKGMDPTIVHAQGTVWS